MDVSIRARQLRRANQEEMLRINGNQRVSIRARQLRRANHAGPQRPGGGAQVSIRARQLRRANRFIRAVGQVQRRFNPRPPITAGESLRSSCSLFQSAPANYGGRIRIIATYLLNSSIDYVFRNLLVLLNHILESVT